MGIEKEIPRKEWNSVVVEVEEAVVAVVAAAVVE